MKVESFDDLFIDLFRDLYNAENQLARAVMKVIERTSNTELKIAFEKSLNETETNIKRLESVAKEMEISPDGKKCSAMEGIITEASEYFDNVNDDDVLDAALIVAVQKAKHYEIASYGTAAAFAHLLEYGNVGNILHEIMEEKKTSDQSFTSLAKSFINEKALLHE